MQAVDVSVGLTGLEFGYDRVVSESNNYRWYVGGIGYIATGDSKVGNEKSDLSSYGLGLYTMILGRGGWFGDAVFRQHFVSIDTGALKTDHTASTLNLEIGREMVFGGDDKFKWFITPSVEGTLMFVSGDDDSGISFDDMSSIVVSASVMAGPRWTLANGQKLQAYGKLGYSFESADDATVTVGGNDFKQAIGSNVAEFGFGANYRTSSQQTSVYLEATYSTGDDYTEVSGNLGLRFAF